MTTAPTANQFITIEVRGRVGIITHSQPERMNVWSSEMADEIRRALRAFDADPTVGAIVWTGTGRAFCAGGDVKRWSRSMAEQPEGTRVEGGWGGAADWRTMLEGWRERIAGRLPKEIFRLGIHGRHVTTTADQIPIVELCRQIKPVVVAYNGYAIGVGLAITLGSDYRLCAASAKISPRFAALGLTPEYGSSHLLPQICGLQNALDLMLGAKILEAEEARRLGLVAAVVPDEELLERAITKASEYAALAPSVTRATKQIIRANVDQASSEKVLRREITETAAARLRPPYKEAVQAFTEKREPDFYKE